MSVTYKHVLSTLVLSLAFTLTSCGGTTDEVVSSAADGGTIADVIVDPPDVALDSSVIADVGVAIADIGAPKDIATPDLCPSGPDCVCKENSDCDSALCIATPDGTRCARTCVDTCPNGFKCAQATMPGGDVLSICVPRYGRLCDPCEASNDCKSLGLDGSACIDQGGEGAFCGIACTADSDCPSEYGCQEVTSTEKAKINQCVRLAKGGEGGKYGVCPCSKAAVAQKLATTCFNTVKDSEGKVSGKCKGKRTCLASGLSKCAAPDVAPEVCDGKDNDCDGEIDEATCDDGNACTTDSCDAAKASGGGDGCGHDKLAAGPCNADGSVCTEGDACVDGVCKAGKAKVCDDKNPCTKDSCDLALGCTKTNDDFAPCDADGSACTVGDECAGGSCHAGKLTVCKDNEVCTNDGCDLKTGKCVFDPLKGDISCDDGSECTKSDTCQDGKCLGKKLDCDDKNPCTSDVCDANKGCQYSQTTAPCSDDNPCTIGDKCKDGKCKIGDPKECKSGDQCILAKCDVTKDGKCSYKNKKTGGTCDDGDACTNKDGCDAGTCEGDKIDCDDNDPCTNESCSAKTGCSYTASTAKCEDGNKCSIGDTCKDKQCISGKAKICDDNELCTADLCDKNNGKCIFAGLPMEATPCNADDSVCTVGDACKGGKCAAGAPKKCDDGNVCTTEGCEAKSGCSHGVNIEACDADSNACTIADTCKDKSCVAGKLKVCNDNNPCTADSCDAKTGKCLADKSKLDAKACDADESLCTINDYCKSGACTAGVKQDCNDNNPCTTDSCDANKGCQQSANTKACDDGNPCTLGDTCAAKKCGVGKAKVCDDNNPCTADSCDNNSGKCVFDGKPQQDKGCDADGSVCTVKDACNNGKCGAGAAKVCKDGNVCTDDGCDKTKGCVFGNNGKICPDASKCTDKETCKAGKCLTSAVLCDDNNPCTKDSCDATKGCLATTLADKTVCSKDNKQWCKAGKCVPKLDCNTLSSCKAIASSDCSKGSGVYTVDLDGSGGKAPVKVWCDMTTKGGGWSVFARVFEENDHSRYGIDVVNNGWAMGKDTFLDIQGVSFSEMIFIRRDNGQFYYVNLKQSVTWPKFGSPYTAGNGYTILANPDYPGQYIRAYDADNGKHYQLCFRDSHNDECGPTSASDQGNYGDAGGNDGQDMLWAGNRVNAIGTGITWDFAIR